ncbi:MAG TPA: molybdenum cofactor guanylyltransferase [Syntrophaceticus sp.]|nr:molybdenum cofactor guanylyltransferase [Syntrophaceticus sp.]
MDAAGIILAGGKSSRFKGNKAFAKISSQRLIERVIHVLKAVFPKIIIVTNTPEEYQMFNAETVIDIIPGRGPLGGMHAGLIASPFELNLVTACDMPFINKELVKYLVAQAGADNDAVVPVIGGYPEPLAAVYRRSCIKYIEKVLLADQFQVKSFYKYINVKYIPEEELLGFGGEKAFFNINTRDDLKNALKMEKEIK